jgi:hypothetical protein
MRIKNSFLLSLLITVLCIVPNKSHAQGNEKWLSLVKEISSDRTGPDELQKANDALLSLPKNEIIAGLEYIVINRKKSVAWANELLERKPDNATASVIGRRFNSWDNSEKRSLLTEPMQRALLTHPEATGLKGIIRKSLLRYVNSPGSKIELHILICWL